MSRKAVLPSWATAISPGKIQLNADKFYPELMDELGFKDVDQYTLEVTLQCAKMDVQAAVNGTDLAPPAGGALVLIINDASKESGAWVQKVKPAGKGVSAATKGGEAVEHYKRIRSLVF